MEFLFEWDEAKARANARKHMSNKGHNDEDRDEDMLPEYDFSGKVGVRGKYYQRLRDGYTIKIRRVDGTTLVQQITRPEGTVTLDPDVQEYFPDSESVNAALRALIQLIPTKQAKRPTTAHAPTKSKSS